MYRAIELTKSDRDLHQFVWRKNPKDPLLDYRMTRVTFGVSASSFAANMSVKQNALDFTMDYPLAIDAVNRAFYVDDGLTGADSTEEAIKLQRQLQDLFSHGGFLLRKWNSNDQVVLQHISPELRDLLQQLWELKVCWDDPVPDSVHDIWSQWRSELNLLSTKYIPRCYFSKEAHIISMELHGFCDASEQAYAAVIYLRMMDLDGGIQVSLVTSKTKVAPIK